MLFSLALLPVALATPTKKWYPSSTNGFSGNSLMAAYIMPDGSLVPGSASCTYGNGSAGINDPKPFMPHPDPFYGSGSVMTSGNQVFVVNAGSNTFSVFDIDPTDPGRPTFENTYSSMGEFPISLCASPDGSMMCVLNTGAMNGFACYMQGSNGWKHMPAWDRSLGLNTTTPPHGPVGGTASQIIFSPDGQEIIVLVKGEIPSDLNNPTNMSTPGMIMTYGISNGQLAQYATNITAALPFSVNAVPSASGTYFLSDVTTGYAMFREQHGPYVTGVIPNQAASCWSAYSGVSGNFYTIDIAGMSNITEVNVDAQALNGSVVSQQPLGVNTSGTDVSIFNQGTVDWMYVDAAAMQSVHVFKIMGPGMFSYAWQLDMGDWANAGIDVNWGGAIAGQAVYYKPW